MGEYLDMSELHPESWRMDELLYLQTKEEQVVWNGNASRMLARRRPITDIVTWVECFSSLAAVITSKFPEKAVQLFSYQRTIVSASQLFDTSALVVYDSRYHRFDD